MQIGFACPTVETTTAYSARPRLWPVGGGPPKWPAAYADISRHCGDAAIVCPCGGPR